MAAQPDSSSPQAPRPPGSGPGPVGRVLDVIGSLPFGITILGLLLLYCWVGSAGLQPIVDWFPRQAFEKTELEWFTWWPFLVIVGLLSLSLAISTVRRVPLTLTNAGVWIVHGGLLVLVAGAAVYYGRKIEGDVLLYRRSVSLQWADGPRVDLLARRGETVDVVDADGRMVYRAMIQSTQAGYRLRSGDLEGEETFAVTLRLQPAGNASGRQSFTRQLLDRYPQFTEDALPGRGRAVLTTERPLVDDELVATLDYAPADRFYVNDRPAIYLRDADAGGGWSERAIHGLARYRGRVADPDEIEVLPGTAPPQARPPKVRIDPPANGDALADLRIEIDGFLPFAVLRDRWRPGGPEPGESAPGPAAARVRIETVGDDGGSGTRRDLVLLDQPVSAHPPTVPATDLPISFRWTDSVSESAFAVGTPRLVITIDAPDAPPPVEVPLADLLAGPVPIEGADYRLSVLEVFPDWRLSGGDRRVSMALVRVESSDAAFVRAVVSPDSEKSRDLDEDGRLLPELLDPRLRIELVDVAAPGIEIVAGPDGSAGAVLHRRDGAVATAGPVDGGAGDPLEFQTVDGVIRITVLEAAPTSTRDRSPTLIPAEQRDLRAGAAYSMIRVRIGRGNGPRSTTWVEHSPYPHPNRLHYAPAILDLPDGDRMEILFSRRSHPLPSPVALEDFEVQFFPGGTRERDYISRVRFAESDDPNALGPPREVRSNHPTRHRGWWFFQSTWDPPSPENGYAGLNFTGLGVGNRHGVGIMLTGAILTVLGSLWAFYAKPLVLRRRGGLRRPGAAAAALLVAVGVATAAPADDPTLSAGGAGLDPLRVAAVQHDGRIKALDTLARETVGRINPAWRRGDEDPLARYLDLLFAPERYRDEPCILLGNRAVRRRFVAHLRAASAVPGGRMPPIGPADLDRIETTGLVSPALLDRPDARAALVDLEQDVRRAGKAIGRLRLAQQLMRTDVLADRLRMIPPPGGAPGDRWLRIDLAGIPAESIPETAAGARTAWMRLATAWASGDPAAVADAAARIAPAARAVEPGLYPSESRLHGEHWYYRHSKLTGGWFLFFLAVPFLLVAFFYRFRWARIIGLGWLLAGFAVQTASIVIRWVLAGRIPNANMFEAIIASSWLGVLTALVMEWIYRRGPLRNLPGLAAAVYGMLTMMAGRFLPVSLNSDITTVMPVLDRTIWLYIHVNVIIASYAVIFFAGVSSVLYLLGRVTAAAVPRFRAAWGTPATDDDPGGGRGLGGSLDAMTMVFLQLGFVTLWVGTILGAIWADVSWGRPWGWDPKEVFALNTWLVLVILVHVRKRTRDRALWTALLALIGCAVMLFNWIAVNFVIVGLHSYA